jgi:sugar lactone lactonase YvrE
VKRDLLFVSSGATGQAYVYDTRTGDAVADLRLATGEAFINDVTLTRDGVYFTDSRSAELSFVPVDGGGRIGEPETIALSGPAALVTPGFTLNGITAVDRGRTLIVAHSANQALYPVDPETGESAVIETGPCPTCPPLSRSSATRWRSPTRRSARWTPAATRWWRSPHADERAEASGPEPALSDTRQARRRMPAGRLA